MHINKLYCKHHTSAFSKIVEVLGFRNFLDTFPSVEVTLAVIGYVLGGTNKTLFILGRYARLSTDAWWVVTLRDDANLSFTALVKTANIYTEKGTTPESTLLCHFKVSLASKMWKKQPIETENWLWKYSTPGTHSPVSCTNKIFKGDARPNFGIKR